MPKHALVFALVLATVLKAESAAVFYSISGPKESGGAWSGEGPHRQLVILSRKAPPATCYVGAGFATGASNGTNDHRSDYAAVFGLVSIGSKHRGGVTSAHASVTAEARGGDRNDAGIGYATSYGEYGYSYARGGGSASGGQYSSFGAFSVSGSAHSGGEGNYESLCYGGGNIVFEIYPPTEVETNEYVPVTIALIQYSSTGSPSGAAAPFDLPVFAQASPDTNALFYYGISNQLVALPRNLSFQCRVTNGGSIAAIQFSTNITRTYQIEVGTRLFTTGPSFNFVEALETNVAQFTVRNVSPQPVFAELLDWAMRLDAHLDGTNGLDLVITPLESAMPVVELFPYIAQPNAGEDVEIVAIIDNPEEVTFRWRKDRVVLPGETNSTLTLTNITGPERGVYDVIVEKNGLTNIVGVSRIEPNPQPKLLSYGAQGGEAHIAAQGLINSVYVLESSADLTSWIDVKRVTNQTTNVEIPVQNSVTNIFYRLRLIE